MPFDGAHRFPSEPEPSRPSRIFEDAISCGIAILAALLLLMPISLGALVDLVKYLHAH